MKFKKILLTLALCMLFNMTLIKNVSAADMLYRLTHNDHDVLIIGTIMQIDEQKINADVSSTLVSTAYLDQINKRVQLNPSKVTIDLTNMTLDLDLKVGDYILASLDKTLFDYKIANGLYKIDSLDKQTLNIIPNDDREKNCDEIALEYFVHSNGSINEFVFESDSVKFVDPDGNTVELFDSSSKDYEETIELEDKKILEQVKAKSYDDAMVVTIILTAGIMLVIILIKFRTKTND